MTSLPNKLDSSHGPRDVHARWLALRTRLPLRPQGKLIVFASAGGRGMRDAVRRLWPELDWIQDVKLRDQVTQTWVRAFELSPLQPGDLESIPFTLLIPNCPVSFMEHKRCVVHIARRAAE